MTGKDILIGRSRSLVESNALDNVPSSVTTESKFGALLRLPNQPEFCGLLDMSQ